MPHSFSAIWLHVIFATKERRSWLTPDIRARLFPYIQGILAKMGESVRAIGGVEDHVHLLMSQERPVPEIVRVAKANTSKWLHESFPHLAEFSWQVGYSAFSVSVSQCDRVVKYIAGQEEHHRRQAFQEELREFLDRHGVVYEERDLCT